MTTTLLAGVDAVRRVDQALGGRAAGRWGYPRRQAGRRRNAEAVAALAADADEDRFVASVEQLAAAVSTRWL
jgi:hypothetical protein